MKIVKPDTMALVHRCLRLHGQDRLCIGLIAMFPLVPEPRMPDLFPEAALWQTYGALAGAPAALDEGYPKARGEFMVYADACAPDARPVSRLAVGVRVGRIARHLLVQGDRHWTALGTPGTPQPFVRMPITPATAFGGPTFADNPLGKGAARNVLPNVEAPDRPMAFADDTPPPAGFWGLDSSAPQRLRHLGAVNADWLRTSWPHLPADTHADFFQCAPADQRMDGFFAGDEAIELGNLHPAQPVLRSALPRLRARCFTQRTAPDGTVVFEETAMHAETVWLMPGADCAAVLYRGTLAAVDPDARDITHLVAGWEPMDGPVESAAFYRTQLPGAPQYAHPTEAQVEPTTEAEPATPPAGLAIAAPPLAELAARPLDPEFLEMQRATTQLDAQLEQLLAEHGMTRADIDAMMRPPELPPTTLEELEGMTQQMEAQTRQLLETHGLTEADVASFVHPAQPEGDVSLETLLEITQQLTDQKHAILREHGLSTEDVAAYMHQQGQDESVVRLMQQPDPDLNALYAALPKAPAATIAEPPAELPSVPPPAAIAPPDAVAPAVNPRLSRQGVIDRHARHESLRGLDLAGLDLSELDLQGADFSQAMLDDTRFEGSRLAGARFDQAQMQRADFSRADASQASFAGARAHASRFANATLTQASLTAGDFTGTDFSSARLANADCTRTDFTGSRMDGLDASASRAAQASFIECALADTRFSGAGLQGARFDRAQLQGARFDDATAERSEWYGAQAAGAHFARADLRGSRVGEEADFSGASLHSARLDRSSWEGVDLRGAHLHAASLQQADFTAIQGQGLHMPGVDARGANFSLADLTGADGRGGNFMGASLRRANLDGTALELANLHGSDCQGTRIGRAHTEGALLTATVLAVPGRPEAGR